MEDVSVSAFITVSLRLGLPDEAPVSGLSLLMSGAIISEITAKWTALFLQSCEVMMHLSRGLWYSTSEAHSRLLMELFCSWTFPLRELIRNSCVSLLVGFGINSVNYELFSDYFLLLSPAVLRPRTHVGENCDTFIPKIIKDTLHMWERKRDLNAIVDCPLGVRRCFTYY